MLQYDRLDVSEGMLLTNQSNQNSLCFAIIGI